MKKQHAPRIKTYRLIGNLDENVKKIENIATQLKKKDGTNDDINKLKSEIQTARAQIKKDEKIKPAAVEALYKGLVAKVDKQMSDLQKKLLEQKNAEEQARLKKIQEELEREKKRKEEEEARLREEEENRRKKAEIEAKRKKEEEERKRQVIIITNHFMFSINSMYF